MAKSFRGPNNKYINSTYTGINLSTTITAPGLLCLNAVAQGTSENSRIGRLARMKWLDIDFEIYQGSTNVPDFVTYRVYIVVETTALGSALAPAQFFVDNTNFTALSQRDRTNRNASRYVVLWDSKPKHLGTIPSSAAGTNAWSPVVGCMQPGVSSYSLHLPLEFTSDYSRGNAGTISDIDTNSLYLLVVSDTSGVTVGGGWTLCFQDDS